MHVHISPDVVERKISDVALAARCAELGIAGFGLKSHYTSTAERARSVTEAAGGDVRVHGAITLNRAVGGLNALAVELAAREGARTVWFPTVNSVNEQHEVHPAPPGARQPVWVKFELELREAGHVVEPVAVIDEEGALLERCFTTPHTGKVSWDLICRASREVGPEHTVWSSDLGQTFNPPVEDGLALMADQFLQAGFSDDEVSTMAVANTRRWAGA